MINLLMKRNNYLIRDINTIKWKIFMEITMIHKMIFIIMEYNLIIILITVIQMKIFLRKNKCN